MSCARGWWDEGIQFVPGESGGDGLGGGGGEKGGVGGDADAAEIEAVGVEADGEGGVGLRGCAVVDAAGGDEEFHAEVVEVEVAFVAEADGEFGTARAVSGVAAFIFPAGVVEEGEEADDFNVAGVVLAKVEAVAEDGAPVSGAMVGVGSETEAGDDKLPERKFG